MFLTAPQIEFVESDLCHLSNHNLAATNRPRAYPIPNSSKFVLPTINAPAFFSFSTTVAGYGLWKPFRIADAHVVGSSYVHMLSFTAIKQPSMADFAVPMRIIRFALAQLSLMDIPSSRRLAASRRFQVCSWIKVLSSWGHTKAFRVLYTC